LGIKVEAINYLMNTKFLYFLFFSILSFTSIAQKTPYNKTLDSLKTIVNSIPNNKIGTFIHHSLSKTIFPHWYGTVWDYNGYTNTPKNGVIACGYFVSTTLNI
jgi:hypothetical protein